MSLSVQEIDYIENNEKKDNSQRPWVSNYIYAAPREYLPLIDENGNGEKLIKNPPLLVPIKSKGLKFRQISLNHNSSDKSEELLKVPIKIRNRVFVFTDKSTSDKNFENSPISLQALKYGAHNYIQTSDTKQSGEQSDKKKDSTLDKTFEKSSKTLYLMPKSVISKKSSGYSKVSLSDESLGLISNIPVLSEISSMVNSDLDFEKDKYQNHEFSNKVVDDGFAKIINNFPYGISGKFLDLKVKEETFSNKDSEYVGNWELLQLEGCENLSTLSNLSLKNSSKQNKIMKFDKDSIFSLDHASFSQLSSSNESTDYEDKSSSESDFNYEFLNQILSDSKLKIIKQSTSKVDLKNNLMGVKFSELIAKEHFSAGQVILSSKVIIHCTLEVKSAWEAFVNMNKPTFESISAIYFDQNILTKEEILQIENICIQNSKLDLYELFIWFYSVLKLRSYVINGSEGTIGVIEQGMIAPHDDDPNAIYKCIDEYVCYIAIKNIEKDKSITIPHKPLLFVNCNSEAYKQSNASDNVHTIDIAKQDKSKTINSDFDDDDAEEIIEMVHKPLNGINEMSAESMEQIGSQSTFSDDSGSKNVKDQITVSTCEQANSNSNYSVSSILSESQEPSERSYENDSEDVTLCERKDDSKLTQLSLSMMKLPKPSNVNYNKELYNEEIGEPHDSVNLQELKFISIFYKIYESPVNNIADGNYIDFKQILDSVQNYICVNHWLFAGFHFLAARYFLYNSSNGYMSFSDFKNALSHVLIFYEMIKNKAPGSIYVDFVPLMGLIMRIALASGQWLLFIKLVKRGHLEQMRRCLGFWDPSFISFKKAYEYLMDSLKAQKLSIEKLQNFASMSTYTISSKLKLDNKIPEDLAFFKVLEQENKMKQKKLQIEQAAIQNTLKKISIKKYQNIGDKPDDNEIIYMDVTKTHPESLVNKFMFPKTNPIPGGTYETAFNSKRIISAESDFNSCQSQKSLMGSQSSCGASFEVYDEVYNLPLIQLSDPLGIGSTYIDSMKAFDQFVPKNEIEAVESKPRLPSVNYVNLSKLNDSKDGKFPPHHFFTNFFYIDSNEHKSPPNPLTIKTSSEVVPDFEAINQAQREYLKKEHEEKLAEALTNKSNASKVQKKPLIHTRRFQKNYPSPGEISKMLSKGLATIFNPNLHNNKIEQETSSNKSYKSERKDHNHSFKEENTPIEDNNSVEAEENICSQKNEIFQPSPMQALHMFETPKYLMKLDEDMKKIPPPPKFHLSKTQTFLHNEYKYAVNQQDRSHLNITMKI